VSSTYVSAFWPGSTGVCVVQPKPTIYVITHDSSGNSTVVGPSGRTLTWKIAVQTSVGVDSDAYTVPYGKSFTIALVLLDENAAAVTVSEADANAIKAEIGAQSQISLGTNEPGATVGQCDLGNVDEFGFGSAIQWASAPVTGCNIPVIG
jgi:hypothetical protein